MTSDDLSKSYFSSAKQILKEAKSLFAQEVWHLVVRRCQECVEFCLKGFLRQAGLVVPRLHDVGFLLKKESRRFPKLPIDRLVSISRRLREEREISFYGDDATETPPAALYNRNDGVDALTDAKFVIGLIKKT